MDRFLSKMIDIFTEKKIKKNIADTELFNKIINIELPSSNEMQKMLNEVDLGMKNIKAKYFIKLNFT